MRQLTLSCIIANYINTDITDDEIIIVMFVNIVKTTLLQVSVCLRPLSASGQGALAKL